MQLQSFIGAIKSYLEEMKLPPQIENSYCGHCGKKLVTFSHCNLCGKKFQDEEVER